MLANKLVLSHSFRARVKDYATNLLENEIPEEFSNQDLIKAGREIANDVVPDLAPLELYELMSFNNGSTSHIVISSGQLPELPPTPYDALVSSRDILEPALFITTVHAMLDLHPVVYEGENDGQIIRNVVPAKKATSVISSHGSKVAFGGHVDNPDLPFFDDAELHSVSIPDNLSLYCLKQQTPSVSTDVILIDEVIAEMDAENAARLMQPVFTVERPASFSGYTDNFVRNVPLLARNNLGQYVSRFDTHRISTNDEQAAIALNQFSAIASEDRLKLQLDLQCGDFVIFKNKRTLHARGAFNPVFDGNDRWLLRVFSMNSQPHSDILVEPSDPAHLKTDLNTFNLA